MPELEFVVSSSIAAIGYDSGSQELYVQFVKSGETYAYYGVEQWVFEEFKLADSKGTYFNMNIKGVYPYGRL